jgi:cell division protein FtsL
MATAEDLVREPSRADLSHLLATVSTIVATILAVALGMLVNAHFAQERDIHELQAQVNAQAVRIARIEAQYGEFVRTAERIEKKLEQGR